MGSLLIVDDIAGNACLIERLLVPDGHVVRTAGGGVEALRLVRADPPDLPITDVMMPQVDRFEACLEVTGLGTGKLTVEPRRPTDWRRCCAGRRLRVRREVRGVAADCRARPLARRCPHRSQGNQMRALPVSFSCHDSE